MDNDRVSPFVSTQRPSRVIPTGTTSYSSGSSAARMLPALTQEIACSVLRPPKTTATRVFRGVLTRATLPCVSKLLHDHAVVVLHTIGARPASASALSTALNGRLPRNPRGFIGLGWPDSITTCCGAVTSTAFFRAYPPHRTNTTRSGRASSARIAASVKCSQPRPACEAGAPPRTVSTALSSSTPCAAQAVRSPSVGGVTPRSSRSSLYTLRNDGGTATPGRTLKLSPC